MGQGARARCPGPSGAAWQPAGAAAAGAAGQGTRLASARASVISHLRSAKTHGLTPSGPNDLWKPNLSAWSETPVGLLQIPLTLLDQPAAKVSDLKSSPLSSTVQISAWK